MPRKPKPKNTLSAGERVALYEAEQRMRASERSASENPREMGEETMETAPERGARRRVALPKPQHATVKVDFSIPVGEIRPVHGMCNGPVSYGADISELYRRIGVPYVRFDGTDTPISAYAVDISRIFKNPDADPAKEENYDFSCTDRYVEAAYKTGARVIFRLGESRDMLGSGKQVVIPEDVDRFARVCVNVIRHYNDYWAKGFALGIKYFELWSHDSSLSGRSLIPELELYRRLANAVALYDDSIKVGGMCFDGFDASAGELVRYCKRTATPLHFLTLSCFAIEPEEIGRAVEQATAYVRNCGLEDVEIVVGKWSYIDTEAKGEFPLERVLFGNGERLSERRRALFEAQCSVKGAAFAAATLLRLSVLPSVTTACFYDAQPMLSPWCAITDRFGKPQKPYYAFQAYGELYRAKRAVFCESEQLDGFAHTGIYARAALSEKGEGYVMLASFGGCGVVDLRFDGIPDNVYSADVYLLDGVKDLTCGDPVPISGAQKRLVLNVSEYGLVVVKLY